MSALLTIGIPTFDRPTELERLLKAIKSFRLEDRVEVLVIDDHPAHAGADAVSASGVQARYLPNKHNLGFPRSLIRLLESCHAPYLMLMADDEHLLGGGITRLLSFVESNRPHFVSPRWQRSRWPWGGYARKAKRTGRIDPREALRAAGHAPGLVFAVERTRAHIPVLINRLAEGCALATTYPQVLLLFGLLIDDGMALQFAHTTGFAGAARPSQIVDGVGRPYWGAESRVAQLKDIRSFLNQQVPSRTCSDLLAGADRIGERRIRIALRREARERARQGQVQRELDQQ